MADLKVGITADDKTAKGIKSAEKNISGLEGSVKNLGKAFATVFAAQKVIQFGKDAAKAFTEDQKSAALLANTMKNLGLQFANPQIEDFIGKLSLAAGVADDQLRPAMQSLLTTNGSLIKSQQLLAQAIDISRGSGVDLAQVVTDLNQAYLGNVKGLKKYNLGLTQAELKASSFLDVQKKLNAQFSGSSQAYLDTYAGKLAVLNTYAGEAKETIGKGLIDALAKLSGGTGAEEAGKNLQTIANGISAITNAVASFIGLGAKAFKLLDFITTLGGITGTNGKMAKWGEEMSAKEEQRLSILRHSGRSSSPAGSWKRAQAAKAAEDAAAKRAKELVKAQKDNTAQIKAQAILKKGQGILDLQQIQLVAALKGDLSEQDRKSAELQLALLNGNDAAAAKLTDQILKAQDATGALTKFVNDLGNTKITDPFTAWYKTLDDVAQKMAAIQLQAQGVSINPNISTNVPQAPLTQMPSAVLAQASAEYQAGQQTIKLMVEGGDEVTSLMRFKILESSMSGSQAQIDRTLGAFDR